MALGRAGANGGIANERLEILWGSRGDPRQHALRRGELVDVQKIIAETKKSLEDLRKALTQVKDDIDTLNNAVLDLEDQMTAVQERISEAEAALTELEGMISDIEGRLTSIDTNILNLQTDVSHLQTDLAALQGSVGSVTTDLAYLNASVTTLQGDVTTLQASVNTLELDVDALQADTLSRFALQSNPGTNPFDPGFEAIPLYTSGELTGGITLTSNKIFTVPVAGLYMFEVEVRINGGAASMPPIGTAFALSIDTTTIPTVPRAGYSVSDVARAMTITRLVCVERLAASAQRVAYFLNQGAAAYQVTSAVVKITRISA